MKTILVTGGTGFIGSNTCVSLMNAGYYINDHTGTIKPCTR